MTEYCFLVETFCLQKQVAKEVASKPVDILSEAAMRNAYYTCHNVQVEMQCIRQDGLKLFGRLSLMAEMLFSGSALLPRLSLGPGDP